ncbi:hypothetical protein [Candidatus Liberibacter solanacearum]|uniref:hypothetical protein n=1 Tax=Candidatus Liberibacter solanacearum TaxID=556287 RepID=UPI0005FA34A5|nr:hypothetical protein [Candidatus Liberibacter solanacearum]
MSNIVQFEFKINSEDVAYNVSRFQGDLVVFLQYDAVPYVAYHSVSNVFGYEETDKALLDARPHAKDVPKLGVSVPGKDGDEFLFIKVPFMLLVLRLAKLPKCKKFERFVDTITFDLSPTNNPIH